ncbi:MAG: hypothetical protein O2857_31395, partial [Planctomycetota bacterium]|nr:hypothetical protein [Planctomycetota bacterium]
ASRDAAALADRGKGGLKYLYTIHHHREADHLGRTVEIAEWIFHSKRLGIITRQLKPICSDNAKYPSGFA